MKTLYYLAALLMAGILSSCEDFLVENPSFALPADESIETVTDLQNAVNGVYSRMSHQPGVTASFYAGDYIVLGDIRGDDMTYNKEINANQISPVARFQYDKNSTFALNFWSAPYVSIGRINDILSVTDNIVVETGEEDTFLDLVGQLYALRALCHFDLVRMFAQLPTALHDGVTMDSPDGIPISDRVFPVDHKPVRNTLQEVYNFILDDFDEAILRLNETPSITTSYGYINIWAAKALKARAQLYLGEYSDALATAEEVINGAGPSGYRLAEIMEYTNIWDLVTQPEFLFEIITNLTYNAQRNSIGYYTDPNGYGEFALTDAFYTYMISDPSDIRAYMAVEKQSDEGTGRGYYPLKYPGREESLYVNNARVIRMAEVYLIAAEAAFHDGDNDKAVQYLSDLQSKRMVNPPALTTVTLDDIMTERRKELFAEGHRSWDVWRNRLSLINADFNPQPVNYDNYRTLIAIPQRETDISQDLKQNPNWE